MLFRSDSFTITGVSSGGTLSNGDRVSIVFMRAGSTGSNGTNGTNGTDPGIRWAFASSTTMADPSAGNLRFNNATLASVTAVAISYNSGETGNPSVANWVKSWDDSTTTAHRGTLIVKKASAPQNYIVFDITGALTDNTTWAQLAVTVLDSAGSLSASDVLSVQFSRTGDVGASGSGTGDVIGASASSDGEMVLYSGTGGKTLKRSNTLSGLAKLASGVVSSATAGTDYMKPDTTSTVSKGFTVTPNNIGTVSSGTTTPDPANGNYQYYTNNGAHTLAAPTSDSAIDILVTNGASAGSITFSGFTVGSSTGSALTTTNTSKFVISIRRVNSVSTYSIYALQ